MRLALISNLYPPIQTGSSYWAAELCENLARSGDQVVVVTCGNAAHVEVEQTGGLTVYRLPAVRRLPVAEIFLRFDQFYMMRSRRNLDTLTAILRDHRIEVVHQCGQLLDSILLTKAACRRLSIPALCSLHSRIYHPGNRMYDALLRLADRSFVKRFAMDDFQLVVALDEVIAAYAEQTYRPRQIEIVPVCINDSVLDLVKADPGSGGPVHIVSVGHVTDMRNRAELLEAAAVLLKDGVNLRVTIAGKLLTHSTRSAVERLGIGGAIQLRGEVERTGVLSLLGEAHVEAHWLTYPGVGSASIEAMAAGLPVLARAYEGIYGDVPLRQMENVVFVNPDSVASVTEPLRALALDGCLRRRIGAAARTLVREHLTWSVTIQKFRALYRGLTG